MGETPCVNSLSFPNSCSVVAPYGADINTDIAGTVSITDFDFHNSITSVNGFIRNETGDIFFGTQMMVAEWSSVSKYNGYSVSLIGHDSERAYTGREMYMHVYYLHSQSQTPSKAF